MKVTTDDVGINATWNRKPSYPLRRTSIAARVALAVAMAVNLVILAGLFPSYFRAGLLNVAGFLLCAFSFAALFAVAARWQKILAPDGRRRPDYALIARMEIDVYGETFEHAGAPRRFPVESQERVAAAREALRRDPALAELDAEMDSIVALAESRAQAVRYGAALCAERGHHIHMLGAVACIVCNGDR